MKTGSWRGEASLGKSLSLNFSTIQMEKKILLYMRYPFIFHVFCIMGKQA